ncbi:unnamed protein product [Owenia fusiformis]|uniref:EGF-like domain-containing protein n=1 Tax=Owenia fusiformis TaxID=6347 RepID=A0A8S4NKK9_OWEFU|nr:unnamed protein product [Owenia fusiformis]
MAAILFVIISSLWSTIAALNPSPMLYIGGETRQLYNNLTFGVYTLEVDASNQTLLFNHRPSYRHESGELYLYYSVDPWLVWAIGRKIGSKSLYVKIESDAKFPEFITEPLYTANDDGYDWAVMDGISIVAFKEGINTCRHLKLSETTAYSGIFENNNKSIGHRPSYNHVAPMRYYLYYIVSKAAWVIDDDFDDTSIRAISAIDRGLDPISTNHWWIGVSTWKRQHVELDCLDGNICRRIQLSGMENSSMNGVYENNYRTFANMPSYRKRSNADYFIYFVLTGRTITGRTGKWVIDTDFDSTNYLACSNTIDINTGAIDNPTSVSSWDLMIVKRLVKKFPKWTCLDDIDHCKDLLFGGSHCKNGGSCIDGVYSYTCNCISGYTGRLCETDIDDCLSSPCINGECEDAVNNYTCTCEEGFTGRDCETDIDGCQSYTCLNGGSCIDSDDGHKCNCVYGYAGRRCETGLLWWKIMLIAISAALLLAIIIALMCRCCCQDYKEELEQRQSRPSTELSLSRYLEFMCLLYTI